MQVNIFQARNRLSLLIKAAQAGEDVVIASNGKPMVRLVPVGSTGRLRGWGKLKRLAAGVDRAFTPEVDADVARSLEDEPV